VAFCSHGYSCEDIIGVCVGIWKICLVIWAALCLKLEPVQSNWMTVLEIDSSLNAFS